VTDGIKYADESESSKPVICISFGMLIPFSCAALIIPCAIKSLDVIITSGSEVIIFFVNSILAVAAGVLAPLFQPLGFGDWRIVTALISGFMAKESVVSTLNVLTGGTEVLHQILNPVAVMSLLVFCLLYTPCVAAISSVKRELGGKWAAAVAVGQCVIAWIAAALVYGIGSLLFIKYI